MWQRFLSFYNNHEKLVNSLSAGVISASGDVLCQLIEGNTTSASNPEHSTYRARNNCRCKETILEYFLTLARFFLITL